MRTTADNQLIQRLNTLTVEWMQRAMDADMLTELANEQAADARERTEVVRERATINVARETRIALAAVKERDEIVAVLNNAPWPIRIWAHSTTCMKGFLA